MLILEARLAIVRRDVAVMTVEVNMRMKSVLQSFWADVAANCKI